VQKWSGNPSDLLSDEQRQRIDDYLGRHPLGMSVDKRGAKLRNYPAQLWNLDSTKTPLEVLAFERPVGHPGLMLVGNEPIPELARAVLVIPASIETGGMTQVHGRTQESRCGRKSQEDDQKRDIHCSVFVPTPRNSD
jgi:hypothetical protein